jgi:glycosyltransferase involved in cell wall biosynthesis
VSVRILFVAPGTSLHTVRWMNQLEGTGFDVHLFPAEPHPLHPGLLNVTVHHPVFRRRPFDERDIQRFGILGKALPPLTPWTALWPEHDFDASVRQRGWWWPFRGGADRIEANLSRTFPAQLSRAVRLARTIERIKPDIVHALEMTTGGYLALAARSQLGDAFPTWIVSNWGCDLQLFARLAEHEERIREMLARCDYYFAECARDIRLAREFGFTGEALPVLPNAGVFDLARVARFRQDGPASARRLIVLKGYQDWHGRALVALRAIEMVAEHLRGYRIALLLAQQPVRIAAELMSRRTNIPVEFVPFSPHDEIMRLHGAARISIGVSISDGIPSSLLEAITMGSFPIQSSTSCADEWITDGTTGSIVPAEDPEGIAAAIRRAATDDALVDRAAALNAEVARERLDGARVRPRVAEMYREVAKGADRRKPSPRRSVSEETGERIEA